MKDKHAKINMHDKHAKIIIEMHQLQRTLACLTSLYPQKNWLLALKATLHMATSGAGNWHIQTNQVATASYWSRKTILRKRSVHFNWILTTEDKTPSG
jgi:hypothetical protein